MGLLKRIFSIGSKKNRDAKKTTKPQIVQVDPGLRAIEEEENEAAVGRLLRSSSTRYAVVSELNYASLSPLPHPINEVLGSPSASTISLASTCTSPRGTYTVKVHPRKYHGCTDIPSTNRDLDDKFMTPRRRYHSSPPKDNSHLLGLRSDPSVASLLDMYDEHGRLPDQAFSNSPPSPERTSRTQTRRTGSTLRQLLGNPSGLSYRHTSDVSALEGDISWAERFLGETSSTASTSSLSLCTPHTPDAQFQGKSLHPNNARSDVTFSTEHDTSSTSENPAISSMEVELSIATDFSACVDYPDQNQTRSPYENPDSKTPQRASQVFDFLTERRRSTKVSESDRPPPDLPSAFSSPSDEDSPPTMPLPHASLDTSSELPYLPSRNATIPPLDSDDDTHIHPPTLEPRTLFQPITTRAPYLPTRARRNTIQESRVETPRTPSKHRVPGNVQVLMAGPTKVIVTAPTPSSITNTPPSRIPRGPRAQAKRRSSGSMKKQRPTLTERSGSGSNASSSKDPFTPLPPRQHKAHRSTTSLASSSANLLQESDMPSTARPVEKTSRSESHTGKSNVGSEKENNLGLSATPEFPLTPLRSHSGSASSRSSLFRPTVNADMFKPPQGMTPSPTSSSELSPVGQQMMSDLRKQRMRAREVDRQRSGGRVKQGSGRTR